MRIVLWLLLSWNFIQAKGLLTINEKKGKKTENLTDGDN